MYKTCNYISAHLYDFPSALASLHFWFTLKIYFVYHPQFTRSDAVPDVVKFRDEYIRLLVQFYASCAQTSRMDIYSALLVSFHYWSLIIIIVIIPLYNNTCSIYTQR